MQISKESGNNMLQTEKVFPKTKTYQIDFEHVDHGLGESQLFLQPFSVGDQLLQISWIGSQTAEVIGQEMIGLDLVHVLLLH